MKDIFEEVAWFEEGVTLEEKFKMLSDWVTDNTIFFVPPSIFEDTQGCDFIIANDISRKDIGFNSDNNEVYILDEKLNIKKVEKSSKKEIAKNILEFVYGKN